MARPRTVLFVWTHSQGGVTESGLAAELTAKGTKYNKDGDLN